LTENRSDGSPPTATPTTEVHRGPLEERPPRRPFPIVAIGASAGGLEALQHLFAALPGNTGMAFLVVQHLDPHHESRLTDLLAKAARMPVVEAAHGQPVEQNHVYVIAPNTNMAIAGGILHLTPRAEGRGPHLPVDFLLRSLAEDQQSRAIGVVLSGAGSDGTLGICEIKAVGGITFAQDARSARYPGMPGSALESGCVDFVLPPEEIARQLADVGTHPYLAGGPPEQPALESDTSLSYKRILEIVRAATGVDFSLYRTTTIQRRITRRMALHSHRTLAEYVHRIERSREEVDALYHDLLINVTSFFRDPKMFETLKTLVFPEIMKGKSPATPWRFWVPGCSTGQESYSLAIAALEFFDDKPVRPPMQIFATDLSDPTSLDKARAGVYPENIEAEFRPSACGDSSGRKTTSTASTRRSARCASSRGRT
jgi:two-component system CheB/CheR fusion protein